MRTQQKKMTVYESKCGISSETEDSEALILGFPASRSIWWVLTVPFSACQATGKVHHLFPFSIMAADSLGLSSDHLCWNWNFLCRNSPPLWKLSKIVVFTCFCSYTFFFWLYHMACGVLVFRPGMGPMPLHWKHGIITTGLPGKGLWQFLRHMCEALKEMDSDIVTERFPTIG